MCFDVARKPDLHHSGADGIKVFEASRANLILHVYLDI